jgi:hypothetical protein
VLLLAGDDVSYRYHDDASFSPDLLGHAGSALRQGHTAPYVEPAMGDANGRFYAPWESGPGWLKPTPAFECEDELELGNTCGRDAYSLMRSTIFIQNQAPVRRTLLALMLFEVGIVTDPSAGLAGSRT